MKRKIQIEGMSCGHCVAHVREALEEIRGIESVEVSLEEKCATIIGNATLEDIKEAIGEAGYDVVNITAL